MKTLASAIVAGVLLLAALGCSVNVGLRKTRDLEEVTVSQEDGRDKILLVAVDGMISSEPAGSFLGKEPSLVATLREQLEKARKDDRVKGVLLRINSPGGTLGATQMIYDELMQFRKDTGKHVLALYLEIAASGGLYVSMAADRIMAYPSSLTGSLGVLYVSPNFQELGRKIGIEYRVVKSGARKDMGTPFRSWPPEEQKLLSDLAAGYSEQFRNVVFRSRSPRGMSARDLEVLSDARIVSADQGLQLHLIDAIGNLSAAIESLEKQNGQGRMKVVTYTRYPDEVRTPYSRTYGLTAATAATAQTGILETLLQSLSASPPLPKGFYYLW